MKELHSSEVFDRILDFIAAKITVWALLAASAGLAGNALFASKSNKLWLAGGASAITLIGGIAKDYERNKKQIIGEIREASATGRKNLFASIMSSTTITANINPATWQPDNLINLSDLINKLQRKHGRIIGGTGDGKSLLAKAIARLIEAEVKVLDIEATKKDWSGFEVIGRGENWQAIANAMSNDLTLLTSRVKEATSDNNDIGWDIFKGQTSTRIVEEYPDVKDTVNSIREALTKGAYDGLADEWCQRIARRGRKPGMLLILISQYDGVTSWGFEGKGTLVDCFHAIRLGQFAIDHAKKVGGKQLEKWIEHDPTTRIMVDNLPCLLPERSSIILLGKGNNSPTAEAQPTPQLEPSDELNEYELAIINWGKDNPDKLVKARELQQYVRLFEGASPEDIRILFQALADKNMGVTMGRGNRLGWMWKSN